MKNVILLFIIVIPILAFGQIRRKKVSKLKNKIIIIELFSD